MGAACLTPLALWAQWSALSASPRRLLVPICLFGAVFAFIQLQRVLLPVNIDDLIRAEMDYVAAVLVFATAFLISQPRTAVARLLLGAVVVMTCVYAIYGFAELMLPEAPLLWFDTPTEHPQLNGTFINRNTFATYAGMGLIVALALISEKSPLLSPGGLHAAFVARTVPDRTVAELIGLCFAILLLACALLLSESRGAILATGAAAAVFIALRLADHRGATLPGLVPMVLAVAAFAVLVLTIGSGVIDRLLTEGPIDAGRILLWQSTLQMIGDASLLGHGFGGWEMAFPAYHPDALPPFPDYDKAHNGYLEILSDLGLIFGAVFLAQFGWVVWRLRRGLIERKQSRTLPQLGLALCVLVGLHAALDYSLQIPAIAVTFAALMGICIARSYGTTPAGKSN